MTVGILALSGCKDEKKPAASQPIDTTVSESKRIVEQVELRIKIQRLKAIGQTTFQQWCAGVVRYKQVYGFYPNIGTTYSTTADSIHKLEAGPGIPFVKALYGKNPTGTPLSGGPTGDRAKYNRNVEEFCSFPNENLENLNTLIDVFGNPKIRVIFDTDGNGRIKNISEPDLPNELAAAATSEGIPARVIIYTKGENGMPDIIAIQ
jgi:hypothetical protein